MKTSILDNFIPASEQFRPRDVEEVFALRLAHRLDDAEVAAHYAQLAGQHPLSRLLMAYRLTLRAGHGGDLGRRFHAELSRLSGDQPLPRSRSLLAIRVHRRCIGAAVFQGTQLDYTERRQLGFNKDKALGSAVRFVNWLLDNFRVDSAALETVPDGQEMCRRNLSSLIEDTLRERLLSIHRIPRSEVFAAFGQPHLRSSTELRNVVTGIWPILKGTGSKVFIQDAVALGLHIQIERLFLQP